MENASNSMLSMLLVSTLLICNALALDKSSKNPVKFKVFTHVQCRCNQLFPFIQSNLDFKSFVYSINRRKKIANKKKMEEENPNSACGVHNIPDARCSRYYFHVVWYLNCVQWQFLKNLHLSTAELDPVIHLLIWYFSLSLSVQFSLHWPASFHSVRMSLNFISVFDSNTVW